MSNELQNLITGLQMRDPRLHQFLMALLNGLTDIENELHPIEQQVAAIITPAPLSEIPTVFYHEFLINPGQTHSHALRFNWINTDPNAVQHEIRKRPLGDTSNDWDSAQFVFRTPYASGIIDPIPTGTTKFLIKSINTEGEYSTLANSINVIVHPMGAPTIQLQVIGYTINVSWSNPASQWMIAQHELYKNDVLVGRFFGYQNFISLGQQAPGVYVFKLRSKNVVGDWSPFVQARCNVKMGPYFPLVNTPKEQRSLFAGYSGSGFDVTTPVFVATAVKPAADLQEGVDGLEGHVALAVGPKEGETWEDHFIDNGWNDFSDPGAELTPVRVYCQPSQGTVSYQETTDFGALMPADVILVFLLSYQEIEGNVDISFETEFSTDGIAWTAPVSGDQVIPKVPFQYTRVKAIFTPDDEHSTIWFFNFGHDLVVRTDVIRPPQITADQDDYDPGEATVLFLDSDAAWNISGLKAGSLDGHQKIVINTGGFDITLQHENAGSAAANRFTCQGGADITLKSGFRATLTYDMIALRWLAVAE